jgi:hypothetical protein
LLRLLQLLKAFSPVGIVDDILPADFNPLLLLGAAAAAAAAAAAVSGLSIASGPAADSAAKPVAVDVPDWVGAASCGPCPGKLWEVAAAIAVAATAAAAVAESDAESDGGGGDKYGLFLSNSTDKTLFEGAIRKP